MLLFGGASHTTLSALNRGRRLMVMKMIYFRRTVLSRNQSSACALSAVAEEEDPVQRAC
jgi:hypothetical protein